MPKSNFQRLNPYINERYPCVYEDEKEEEEEEKEEDIPEEIIDEMQLRIQEAQKKLNNIIEISNTNVPKNGGQFLIEELDFNHLTTDELLKMTEDLGSIKFQN
ncbi:hypothetical protein G9A89_002581 [Geosiphon pyriformis]|nr:hypothetical protein G9A89_002581 [Geosiphon pyriformis]